MKRTHKLLLVLLTLALLVGAFAVMAMASDTGNEAKIDTTEYATLAEALAAVQEGETVTLLKDVTVNANITVTVTYTLDIDGHTLSLYNSLQVKGGATLTLTNSGTTGTVKLADGGDGKKGYIVADGGSLTLKDVTVDSTYHGFSAIIAKNGTAEEPTAITLQGGKVYSHIGTLLSLDGHVNVSATEGSELRTLRHKMNNQANKITTIAIASLGATGTFTMEDSVFEYCWRAFVQNFNSDPSSIKVAFTLKNCDIYSSGSNADGVALSRAVNVSISGGTYYFNAQNETNASDGNYGNTFEQELGAFTAVTTFDSTNPTVARFSQPLNTAFIASRGANYSLVKAGLLTTGGELWYQDDGSGYPYLYATAEQIATYGLQDSAVLSPFILRSRGDFNDADRMFSSWYGSNGGVMQNGLTRCYEGVFLNVKWGKGAAHSYTDANGFTNTYFCFYSDKSGEMTTTGEDASVLWNSTGNKYNGGDTYVDIAFGNANGATATPAFDYQYYVASFDLFTESSFLPAIDLVVQTRRGEDNLSKGPGMAYAVVNLHRQADGSLQATVTENGTVVGEPVTLQVEAYEALRFTYVIQAEPAKSKAEDEHGTLDTSKSLCMIYLNGQPLSSRPIKWVGQGGGKTINILDGIRIVTKLATITAGENFCLDNICTTAYKRVEGGNATLASLMADATKPLTGLDIFGVERYVAKDGAYRNTTNYYLPTGNPIAAINGVKYDSFAAALAAAKEGDTIELLRDVKYPDAVKKNIKVDTKGHAYTLNADSYGYTKDGNVLTYSDTYGDVTISFWYDGLGDGAGEELATTKVSMGGAISYPDPDDSRLSSTFRELSDGKYAELKFVGWSQVDFNEEDATKDLIVDAEMYGAAINENDGVVYLYACFEEVDVTPSYIVYEEDATNVGSFHLVALYTETDMLRYSVFTSVVKGLEHGQYVKLNTDIKYTPGYAPGIKLDTLSTATISIGIDLNGHEIRIDHKGCFMWAHEKHNVNIFSSQSGGIFNARSLDEADKTTPNYNRSGYSFYASAHGHFYFGKFRGSLLQPAQGTGAYGDNITFRVGVLIEIGVQWSSGCGITLDGGTYHGCVGDSWGLIMSRASHHSVASNDCRAQIDIKGGAKIYITATGDRSLFGFPDASTTLLDIKVNGAELYCVSNIKNLFNGWGPGIKITWENVVGSYPFAINQTATSTKNITLGAGNVFSSIDDINKYTLKDGVVLALYNGEANKTFTHKDAYTGNRTDGYDKVDKTESWTGKILTYNTVATADTVTVSYTDLAGKPVSVVYAKGGNVLATLDDATVGMLKKSFAGWEGTTENLQENTTLTPKYTVTANVTGMKQNLSLYSSFAVNLYVPVHADITAINGVAVKDLRVTKIGETNYYVATLTQNASAAGADLTFTVDVAQGEDTATQTVTLSSVRYAAALQASEGVTTEDKTFLAYMLNYVKAAYTYFGLSEQLPDTVDTLLAANAELMTGTVDADTPVNTVSAELFKGASLDLREAPTYLFYLTNGFEGAVRFTYTNYKGETVTVEKAVTADDTTVALSEMRAYDFAATVSVEVKVGDGAYTAAGQYNLAAYEPSDNVEATNALVEVLQLYIQSAKTYKAYMDTRA